MKALQLAGAFLLGAAVVAAITLADPHLAQTVRERIQPAAPIPPKPADPILITDRREGGFDHFLGPSVSVRTAKHIGDQNDIWLELIVDQRGDVLDAHAKHGPVEFFAEAERIAKRMKFIPFQRNGMPVVARIAKFDIAIYPTERRPDYRVAFPAIKDRNSLVITMLKVQSEGGRLYDLEIRGNGDVIFNDGFAIPGTHGAHIAQEKIDAILAEMRRAEFFWLFDSYQTRWSHPSITQTRISFDGRTKMVADLDGRDAGMPDAVRDVEQAIDRAVDVDRWVRGNAETGPSLVAEHWDFKAKNEANDVMLYRVAQKGTVDAMRDLIALGAPLRTGDGAPIVPVARRGHAEMLSTLLDQPVTWHADALGEALVAAAGTGEHNVVLPLIWRDADIFYRSRSENKWTPLMAASEAGSREVVEILLGYARQPRSLTSEKTSPAKLAAYVNARDSEGMTSLQLAIAGMCGYDMRPNTGRPQVVQLLLETGADPTLKDNEGLAAVERACGNGEAMSVLKKWVAEHPAPAPHK